MDRRASLHSSTRASVVDLPVAEVRAVVASGRRGPQWYVDALPFVLRGALDRLLDGPVRSVSPPGRELLRTGDRAGFWRVVASTETELRLEAVVRAPGTVTLTTTMEPVGSTSTRVRQTVSFAPTGLAGRLYLLADLPAREAVIEGAHRHLRGVLAAAEAEPG